MKSFLLQDKNKTTINISKIIGVELIIQNTGWHGPKDGDFVTGTHGYSIISDIVKDWRFNMFTKYYIIDLVYEDYEKAKIDNEALKRIIEDIYG